MTDNQKAALESAIDKLKGYWEADELSALLSECDKDTELTDEQIAKIWAEHGAKGNAYTFARAILAANKEKP